jgi:predicted secreted protein
VPEGRVRGSIACILFACCLAAPARADNAPTPQPVVTVTASANRSVPNDRMHAVLRAEAEDADAVKAASAVNARMARALARAKASPGVQTSTSSYTTYQSGDPTKGPVRWRVAQSLDVTGSDFVAMAALVSALQAEDGLLVSGVNFSVSPAALRAAEDALVQQAIRGWQQRAQIAAQAFGSATWRTGRVTVQTSEPDGGPRPLMRVQAMSAAQPVSVEAGNTEVTVTVTGEAILENKNLQ